MCPNVLLEQDDHFKEINLSVKFPLEDSGFLWGVANP